eukprot:Clim_evm19s208 gene=Clim_evmTU19s208
MTGKALVTLLYVAGLLITTQVSATSEREHVRESRSWVKDCDAKLKMYRAHGKKGLPPVCNTNGGAVPGYVNVMHEAKERYLNALHGHDAVVASGQQPQERRRQAGCPCTDEELRNKVCDKACYVEECDWDRLDCGSRDNSFEFPATDCHRSWIGDGVSDLACMVAPEAQYDRDDGGQCAPGCPWTRRRNTRCDAACNVAECDNDDGACDGYCAPGCPPEFLGNGRCDAGCFNDACDFDGGECESECSPGCDSQWLGDGVCHDQCNTSACGHDRGDCYCSPGCSPRLLKNDQCDSPCDNDNSVESLNGTVIACEFDNKRCLNLCPFNCLRSWLGDGVCDLECNIKECNFDFGDCEGEGTRFINCPCGSDLLDNGVCDLQCDTEPCMRDNGDCVGVNCAAGCTDSMRGNMVCDAVCNNPECFYDTPEDPVSGKPTGTRDCIMCSPGCSADLIGNGVCDVACYNEECTFDGGDCETRCSAQCVTGLQVGDGTCDYGCFNEACDYDKGDCEEEIVDLGSCPFCLTLQRGDGFCDEACLDCADGLDDFGDCAGLSTCDTSLCPLRLIGDGQCHIQCNSEECNYDAGDCNCSPGCTPSLIGDGTCDPVCNNANFVFALDTENGGNFTNSTFGCGFDGGDCSGECPCALGNGICDEACNKPECDYDQGDCGEDYCAPGCPIVWTKDTICDRACNVEACNFDNGACLGICSLACPDSWRNDTICDPGCWTPECDFDGDDCVSRFGEGSEPCAPTCPEEKLGDGICDPDCFTTACNFDDGDCDGRCAPGCLTSWLGDGKCDQPCNVESCNFDTNGDVSDCGSTPPEIEIDSNIFERSRSGCPCWFDVTRNDCACCYREGCVGCQEPAGQFCVRCENPVCTDTSDVTSSNSTS